MYLQATSTYAAPPEMMEQEADKRILIVDDEAVIRDLFTEFLGEKYVCTAASSADEALAYMSVHSYALVISDMMMPGRNGVELLREIKIRYPDTMVIMVSAIDRIQRVRDALRVGACDYLIKPVELDILGGSVERALERRAFSRMAQRYKADLEKQNIELATRKAELERLQAQLVHNEKMASLGQLAAGVAHELNNPAGFIYGNMDLLEEYQAGLSQLLSVYDESELPPPIASKVQAIKQKINYDLLLSDLTSIVSDCREGAERIRKVVINLRLFSRLDQADVQLVDLHEGIDSTIRLLSRYYNNGRIRLVRKYADLPMIGCYAGQLNQVWMNLLANAAQAIDGEGEVRISTHIESGFAQVVISDTGCGIPEEQLHKIFDPFFTTKAVGEGTGLGLSTSYGIIERHGGTIRAESKMGEGTSFIVNIPLEAKPRDDGKV